MPKIEILCPEHGAVETIELPESYAPAKPGRQGGVSVNVFEGQIACGGSEHRVILQVKVMLKSDGQHTVESVASTGRAVQGETPGFGIA